MGCCNGFGLCDLQAWGDVVELMPFVWPARGQTAESGRRNPSATGRELTRPVKLGSLNSVILPIELEALLLWAVFCLGQKCETLMNNYKPIIKFWRYSLQGIGIASLGTLGVSPSWGAFVLGSASLILAMALLPFEGD